MSLPPSIEAIVREYFTGREPFSDFIQRIAAEACRLQREADWDSQWGWRDAPTVVHITSSPLVVEKPK